jgi:hypothetical protein
MMVLGTLSAFLLFSYNYEPPHEQAKATLRKHMTAVRPAPAGEAAAVARRRTSAAAPQQQQQQQPRDHTH